MEFNKVQKAVLENYDKEGDIFHASSYIREIAHYMTISEEAEKLIEHIAVKCETIEDHMYKGDKLSPAYKKVQSTSICEDCKKLINIVNNRASYDKIISKKELGRVISAAKYFVENTVDKDAVIEESTNALFNKYMKDETEKIEQIL